MFWGRGFPLRAAGSDHGGLRGQGFWKRREAKNPPTDRISLQARMYEEARVIEIRRRQREVYERIKVLFQRFLSCLLYFKKHAPCETNRQQVART